MEKNRIATAIENSWTGKGIENRCWLTSMPDGLQLAVAFLEATSQRRRNRLLLILRKVNNQQGP
jgi:hypothetical protein